MTGIVPETPEVHETIIEDEPELVVEEGDDNVLIDDDHMESTTIVDESVSVNIVVETPEATDEPVSACCEHCASHEARLAAIETVDAEIETEAESDEPELIEVDETPKETGSTEAEPEKEPETPTETPEAPKKKSGARKMLRR